MGSPADLTFVIMCVVVTRERRIGGLEQTSLTQPVERRNERRRIDNEINES